MAEARIHKLYPRKLGGFVNAELASGERVFFSLSATDLRVYRMYLRGLVPGRRLFAADDEMLNRLIKNLKRHVKHMPELPKSWADAVDLAEMAHSVALITDPTVARRPDPVKTLALLARLSLAEPDAASLSRRLSRAAHTVA